MNIEDCGALWLPMTSPHFVGPVIATADGLYVKDTAGRRYLHATSGLWNVNCGFGVEPISQAIKDQADRVAYSTLFRYSHEPAVRLAEELVRQAPGDLSACFFTCSGGTAVEAGIKAARKYWTLTGEPDRRLIVSFGGSYHGTSYGALAVSHTRLGQEVFGVDESLTRFVAWPGADGGQGLEDLESLLRKSGLQVAAVLYEPVQGTEVRVMPRQFAQDLDRLRKEYGFLLYADEVTTGFGRTGTMFASEWLGLDPDIMALSKGINGGYLPLGATLFTSRIRAAFDACGGMFETGETQAGNPLACAAALATIEHMRTENLVERGAAAGRYLSERLSSTLCDASLVKEVRGRGLMVGIELQESVTQPPGATWTYVAAAQERGVIVHAMPCGVALLPPLTIAPEEVEIVARTLSEVLS